MDQDVLFTTRKYFLIILKSIQWNLYLAATFGELASGRLIEVLSEISIMHGINVTLFECNIVVTTVWKKSPGYTF